MYVVGFNERTIGLRTDKSTITIFVVEGTGRRNFRDAAVAKTRKDLLVEPSHLENIFDKRLGLFTVSNVVLKQSKWLLDMTMRINRKIDELFKWAAPSR